MPPQVKGINSIIVMGEWLNQVREPPAVLAETMNNHQYSTWSLLWMPFW